MADNVLEPYTFSFGDAKSASIECSSRVWVFPNKYFATQNKQIRNLSSRCDREVRIGLGNRQRRILNEQQKSTRFR